MYQISILAYINANLPAILNDEYKIHKMKSWLREAMIFKFKEERTGPYVTRHKAISSLQIMYFINIGKPTPDICQFEFERIEIWITEIKRKGKTENIDE